MQTRLHVVAVNAPGSCAHQPIVAAGAHRHRTHRCVRRARAALRHVEHFRTSLRGTVRVIKHGLTLITSCRAHAVK